MPIKIIYALTATELAQYLYSADGIELEPVAVARLLDKIESQAIVMDRQVLDLKEKHRFAWRARSQWYWLWRLGQEFVELALSLAGRHRDPPDWELAQIASIAMNWLEMRRNF